MDKKYFKVGDLIYLKANNKIYYGKITKFQNPLYSVTYRADIKVKWFDNNETTNERSEFLIPLELSNIWNR